MKFLRNVKNHNPCSPTQSSPDEWIQKGTVVEENQVQKESKEKVLSEI